MMRTLKRAWRKAARLLRAILRRGSIEPVILFLVLNLVLSGATLLAAHSTPVLLYPKVFGTAFLSLATVGACGLFGRDDRLKAAFGFLGLFLRLWMTVRFFLSDWQNVDWCTHALGAFAYGWIAARSACRHVWLEVQLEVRRGAQGEE